MFTILKILHFFLNCWQFLKGWAFASSKTLNYRCTIKNSCKFFDIWSFLQFSNGRHFETSFRDGRVDFKSIWTSVDQKRKAGVFYCDFCNSFGIGKILQLMVKCFFRRKKLFKSWFFDRSFQNLGYKLDLIIYNKLQSIQLFYKINVWLSFPSFWNWNPIPKTTSFRKLITFKFLKKCSGSRF